jgi:hypothetical protein
MSLLPERSVLVECIWKASYSRWAAILGSALLIVAAPASLAYSQAQPEKPSSVVPLPATRLPRTHKPQPTSAAISPADLMTRLYIFADDSMMGREAGTLGSFKATTYIADEVRRIGLRPAGDSGGYFQVIPFKQRTVDTSSVITVGTARLPFGRGWGAAPPSDIMQQNQPTVYGGVLTDSSFLSPDSITGKVVVARLSPTNIGGSFQKIAQIAPRSAGIIVIGPAGFLPYFTQPMQYLDEPGTQGSPLGQIIYTTDSVAAPIFDTPLGQLTPGTAGKPIGIEIHVRTGPTPYPARNVVAILPGSDPRLRVRRHRGSQRSHRLQPRAGGS